MPSRRLRHTSVEDFKCELPIANWSYRLTNEDNTKGSILLIKINKLVWERKGTNSNNNLVVKEKKEKFTS